MSPRPTCAARSNAELPLGEDGLPNAAFWQGWILLSAAGEAAHQLRIDLCAAMAHCTILLVFTALQRHTLQARTISVALKMLLCLLILFPCSSLYSCPSYFLILRSQA